MKSIFTFTLLPALLLLSFASPAQKIFSCDHSYEAGIKVFVTKHAYEAELLVYRVKNAYEAGENDGKWFFTRYNYEADKLIFFVDYKYEADLVICFVDHAYEAGWRENQKKYLLY